MLPGLAFLLCFFLTSILYAQCPGFAGTISGADTVYQGQTMVGYTVPAIANTTSYEWTLPLGATITAGTTTNNITVSFGESATGGNITVKGINNCGEGTVSPSFGLFVKNVIPSTYTISGTTVVYKQQQGVTYSVAIPNVSQYKWSLPPGAAIVGKQDTSQIMVDYGLNAESGSITVIATNASDAFAIKSSPRSIVVSPIIPPNAPDNLKTEVLIPSTSVQLTWRDNSDNENAFLVYRSQTTPDNFVLIHTSEANATTFIDSQLTPNTSYYYKIKAAGISQVQSEFSLTAQVTTTTGFVNIPKNLQAAPAPQLKATLNWVNQAAQVEGYEIYRSDDNVVFSMTDKLNGATAISYTDGNLSPLTTYYYKIKAFNNGTLSAFTPSVAVTTLNLPPAPPSNLVANVVSNTALVLQWTLTASADPTIQLILERSPNANVGFTAIDTFPASQNVYQDANLTNNTTYFYRMRAFNINGFSAYSNLSNATTSNLLAPANVTLQIINDSRAGIEVNWINSSANVTGFIVERANVLEKGGQFGKVVENYRHDTDYLDTTGIKPNQVYHYRIKALNQAISSPYSEIKTIAIPKDISITIPSAPSGLDVRPVSANALSLTWQDNDDSTDFFRIERSENDTTNFMEIATVPAASTDFQDVGLTNNQTYYYRISAGNGGGESGYSNIDNASVACNLIFELEDVDSNTPITVCEGNAVVLKTTANTKQGVYQWKHNGLNIPNAHQSFYYAKANGEYFCEIRDGQCQKTSGTVTVIVNDRPEVVFNHTSHGLDLKISSFDTIVWFREGQILIGENEFRLSATAAGFHYAMVGLNGCFSTSNKVFVPEERLSQNLVSLSPGFLSKAIKAYPNPFASQINVTLRHSVMGKYQIEVFDIHGKTRQFVRGRKHQQVLQTHLSLNDLPAGLYFMKIQAGNLVGSKMIIKH